jgi:hypothetical protein
MNMYNPYIQQMPQTQELGGLSPYYQNIAQQQALQNAAMQQAQGLTQQAGQTAQGGMNPMMMAQMLRKKDQKPAPVTDYSQPMPQYLDPAYMQAGY